MASKKERAAGTRSLAAAASIRKNFGWIPDFPDQRDYRYRALRPIPRKLPRKIDLRADCSNIEDQGDLGSCTANALAGAVEFLERKDSVAFIDASRLFIYYNERVIEHTVKEDSGAMIRDGIKTLAKQGVCTESIWPYTISKFTHKPSATCYKQAAARCIQQYARLETLDEMRACLADGYTFVFGFSVYTAFESQQVARSGVLNMPKKTEKLIGGHAVMAAGYNDTDKRFIVRNSWGTDWGMKGYFTMPYAYLEDRNLSDDIWTIRRGSKM